MRIGSKLARAATLLTVVGGVASLALVPTAAAAAAFHGGGFHGGGGGGFHGGGGYGGFRGGGYGGFHGGYGYRGYGGFGYGCCYGGYYGGFGLGDALLGAAIIGGTAAVIAADEPNYYATYPAPYPVYAPPVVVAPPPGDYGYAPPPPPPGQPGQPQAYQSNDPVDQCTRAAIGEAAARGDSGRVTKIDHVDGFPNGAHVTGTLEVRRTSHDGTIENARFTCTADYGQVTAFRFG